MDEIIKAISSDGYIAISAISARGIAERARIIHHSSPVVTAALGRTLSAASIIGCDMKKEGSSLTVRINGGGPSGSIIVVSDENGNVRGYVQNPAADLPKNHAGKLDVGGVVGRAGMLSIVRDFGVGEPYRGSVELVSGEIAEDFAAYFAVSEQIPTACAFGVLVGRDRSVLAAGGYIIRLMPGAPDEIAGAVEENVAAVGAVTDVLANGNAGKLLESVMIGFSPRILEQRSVSYKCPCSRERILSVISGMSKSEIADMEREGKPIEVTCQFCDEVYNFDMEELV